MAPGPLKISDSVSFVSLSKTCHIAPNETLLQGLRHRKPSLHRPVLSVHSLFVLLCLSRRFELIGHSSSIDKTKKTRTFHFFHSFNIQILTDLILFRVVT